MRLRQPQSNPSRASRRLVSSRVKRLALLAVALIVVALGVALVTRQQVQAVHHDRVAQSKSKQRSHAVRPHKVTKPKRAAVMRTPIDWHLPSETAAYPDLTHVQKLSMEVRLDKQRVYIRGNGKLLYTMYASTGIDGRTPEGHFSIGQRGLHFFNSSPAVRLGANYWTSIYQNRILFHTVPFDAQGHYDIKEASDLGKRAGSHGCVQLSIPDAKWIYDKIPEGTPVTIDHH